MVDRGEPHAVHAKSKGAGRWASGQNPGGPHTPRLCDVSGGLREISPGM